MLQRNRPEQLVEASSPAVELAGVVGWEEAESSHPVEPVAAAEEGAKPTVELEALIAQMVMERESKTQVEPGAWVVVEMVGHSRPGALVEVVLHVQGSCSR